MKAIITILSLILGLVVACVIMTICNMLTDDAKTISIRVFWKEKIVKIPSQITVIRAIIWGVAIATMNRLAPYVPVAMNVIFAAILAGAMAYLVLWWIEQGSTIREMIAFIILEWLVSLVLTANMIKFAVNMVGTKVWMAIPNVLLVMSIGTFVANYIWFHQELMELKSNEGGE